MQMMTPHFAPAPAPARAPQLRSDNQATMSTRPTSSTAQNKKYRWTETEEKILIALFGENENKLSIVTRLSIHPNGNR